MSRHDDFQGDWLKLDHVLIFGGSGSTRNDLQKSLDNYYVSPFDLDERKYNTIEHAFQAAKFRDAGDDEHAEKIRLAPSPADAKALGQAKRLPPDALDRWRQGGADTAMRKSLGAKFSTPSMRDKLLSTGDRPLAEQVDDDPTWDDRRWGVGKEEVGDGQNKLGKMLMQLRDELRATR